MHRYESNIYNLLYYYMRMFTKSYTRHEYTTSNRQWLPNYQIIYNCVVLKIILLEYLCHMYITINFLRISRRAAVSIFHSPILSLLFLSTSLLAFEHVYQHPRPLHPLIEDTCRFLILIEHIILYMRSRFSSFNYVSSSIIYFITIYVVYEYVYSSRAFIIRVPYNIIANIKLSVVECWRRVSTHYYENVPM